MKADKNKEGISGEMAFLSFILTSVTVTLYFMLFHVLKKRRCEREKRERLCVLGKQLLEIQLHLLLVYGFKEDEFEIEIAKYLRDYLFPTIVSAKGIKDGRARMHSHIVWKYPQIFEDFDKELQDEACSERDIREWQYLENAKTRFEQANGEFQEKYDMWRRMAENAKTEWRYTDCIFPEARERLAEAFHITGTIPFEVMLCYERNYESRH